MEDFLSSKLFVFFSTLLTLIIGGAAGWLLGYQPEVSGKVSGTYYTSGSTSTEYVFRIQTALGFWLFAILISFVVFLVSLSIRNHYIQKAD